MMQKNLIQNSDKIARNSRTEVQIEPMTSRTNGCVSLCRGYPRVPGHSNQLRGNSPGVNSESTDRSVTIQAVVPLLTSLWGGSDSWGPFRSTTVIRLQPRMGVYTPKPFYEKKTVKNRLTPREVRSLAASSESGHFPRCCSAKANTALLRFRFDLRPGVLLGALRRNLVLIRIRKGIIRLAITLHFTVVGFGNIWLFALYLVILDVITWWTPWLHKRVERKPVGETHYIHTRVKLTWIYDRQYPMQSIVYQAVP